MKKLLAISAVCATLSACTDDPQLNAAYTAAFISGLGQGAVQPLPSVLVNGGGKSTLCLAGGTPQLPTLFCQ